MLLPPIHILTCTSDENEYPLQNTTATFTVSVEAPLLDSIKTRTVVLVLDNSGSMSGEKMMYLRTAASFVINNLTETETLAIVIFDTEVSTMLPPTRINNDVKAVVDELIADMHPSKCTNISGAIATAFDLIKPGKKAIVWRHKRDSNDAKRHRPSKTKIEDYLVQCGMEEINGVCGILFLTDGAANVGIMNTHNMNEMVRELKAASGKHVELYAFGLGDQVNNEFLSGISEEYMIINNPQKIPREFAHVLGSLRTLTCKDLVIKIELYAGVKITSMHTQCKMEQNEKQIIVYPQKMFVGSKIDIIVCVELQEQEKTGTYSVLFTEFSADNLVKGRRESSERDLLVHRNKNTLEPPFPNADETICKMRSHLREIFAKAALKISADEAGDAHKDLDALLVETTALYADMRERGTEVQQARAGELCSYAEEALKHAQARSDDTISRLCEWLKMGMPLGGNAEQQRLTELAKERT